MYQTQYKTTLNSLPQASQSQILLIPKVVEVAIEVEVVEVEWRGGLILCYWCRDFLPKEQANHKVVQCPYQNQARNDCWQSQLSSTQGGLPTPQSEGKENC